jgi:hypothetical protein
MFVTGSCLHSGSLCCFGFAGGFLGQWLFELIGLAGPGGVDAVDLQEDPRP